MSGHVFYCVLLIVSYINNLELTERFALSFRHSLESDQNGIYQKLAWWFADGVLNFEPHGMFRAERPYGGSTDKRTIAEYLDQEPQFIWNDVTKLRDLFNTYVHNILKDSFIEMYKKETGQSINDEDWFLNFQNDWEKALFLMDLNPEEPESIWSGFLKLRIYPLVERFRSLAEKEAKKRRLSFAQLVTQTEMEDCIVRRVSFDYSGICSAYPELTPLEWLEKLENAYGDAGFYEMSVFVNSPCFAKQTPLNDLEKAREYYVFPDDVHHSPNLELY